MSCARSSKTPAGQPWHKAGHDGGDNGARYIATPRVAKHRLFVWLPTAVCPDSQIIVIARDDDTTVGILHSRFHEALYLRGYARPYCGSLEPCPNNRLYELTRVARAVEQIP